MQFRTNVKGERITTECLECNHCGTQMYQEQELCIDCGSDSLSWYTQYTVYQTVFAKDPQDAFETANQIDQWLIIGGRLLLHDAGENKDE